jgi:hypothetical protein
MAMIEIKDLNLVSDGQDLQDESLESSTTLEIRGGYNPYNNPIYHAASRVPDEEQSKPKPTVYWGAMFYV